MKLLMPAIALLVIAIATNTDLADKVFNLFVA